MLDAADHQMAETLENAENHKEQIANIAVHTYEVCGLNPASLFFHFRTKKHNVKTLRQTV